MAKAFHDLMFNECKPAEAIERYAGDVYIQDNPHVGDGKQAFVEYFECMAAEYPGQARRVQARARRRRLRRPALPADVARRPRLRRIDIFRFDENGRVVEHWDVLQIVPAESANDNTMF